MSTADGVEWHSSGSMLPQISRQMDNAARAFEKHDQDTIDDAHRPGQTLNLRVRTG